ncbi:protein-lysine N-methyltransferase Efm2p [Diutina catenulata]
MFDPLDLFTPDEARDDDSTIKPSDLSAAPNPTHSPETAPNTHQTTSTDDELDEPPLHVLDLPNIGQQPPFSVLTTTLHLLSPVYTIDLRSTSPVDDQVSDPHQVLSQHLIPQPTANEALAWLGTHSRFTTLAQLVEIAFQSDHLKSDTQGFNSYMTRLLSHPLSWMGEEDAELIRSEAARRLAENCGRTALPDLVRTLVFDHEVSLKVHEPALTSDNLGLKTWGASLVLAKRLLAQRYLEGSVLELGAGTGVVGLVCALQGHPTILTDLPEICGNLQHNVTLNGLDNALVAPLDWTNHTSFTEQFPSQLYDTIVVADPIYSSQHPYWVSDTIFAFLKPGGRLLIEVPIRENYHAERATLWELLRGKYGQPVEELEEHEVDADWGHSTYAFRVYHYKV